MIVHFTLERMQGEAFLKNKGNAIPNQNGEMVTTYMDKNGAIYALKREMNTIIKSDMSAQHHFMLFEYYVDNASIKFDMTEGNDKVDTLSKMLCPNNFPIENLLTVESLFFYHDKNNRVKFKRCSKYVDPEILEELRKENDELFSQI